MNIQLHNSNDVELRRPRSAVLWWAIVAYCQPVMVKACFAAKSNWSSVQCRDRMTRRYSSERTPTESACASCPLCCVLGAGSTPLLAVDGAVCIAAAGCCAC